MVLRVGLSHFVTAFNMEWAHNPLVILLIGTLEVVSMMSDTNYFQMAKFYACVSSMADWLQSIVILTVKAILHLFQILFDKYSLLIC